MPRGAPKLTAADHRRYRESCPRCKSRKQNAERFREDRMTYGHGATVELGYGGYKFCHACSHRWGFHDKRGTKITAQEFSKRILAAKERWERSASRTSWLEGKGAEMAKAKKTKKTKKTKKSGVKKGGPSVRSVVRAALTDDPDTILEKLVALCKEAMPDRDISDRYVASQCKKAFALGWVKGKRTVVADKKKSTEKKGAKKPAKKAPAKKKKSAKTKKK